jgi:DNA mismatch endonuclease, patch repair protein
MSHISGKETKPEILVRKYLFHNGFRFRKNVKSLPGKPDIVLAKYRTIVFIHGCFWHQHKNCLKSKLPATRREFWEHKLTTSAKRDKINEKTLLAGEWNVITVWQCELNNQAKRLKRLELLKQQLKSIK